MNRGEQIPLRAGENGVLVFIAAPLQQASDADEIIKQPAYALSYTVVSLGQPFSKGCGCRASPCEATVKTAHQSCRPWLRLLRSKVLPPLFIGSQRETVVRLRDGGSLARWAGRYGAKPRKNFTLKNLWLQGSALRSGQIPLSAGENRVLPHSVAPLR